MSLFNAFDRAMLLSPGFDERLAHLVSLWDNPPTALQVFRVVDEIKLMRSDKAIAPYKLIEKFDSILEAAMKRENITYKELSNKALWRDQNF